MKKCCECKRSVGEYFSFKSLSYDWFCANCYKKLPEYNICIGSGKIKKEMV